MSGIPLAAKFYTDDGIPLAAELFVGSRTPMLKPDPSASAINSAGSGKLQAHGNSHVNFPSASALNLHLHPICICICTQSASAPNFLQFRGAVAEET